MTNSVSITKRLTGEGWSITGALTPVSQVPKEIFVYENTGDATLGTYHSVVTVADLPRIPIYSGSAVPLARSRYVRASTIKILISDGRDVDVVISELKASLKKFVKEFNSEKESTQIYVLD